jgi:hypothetical protein
MRPKPEEKLEALSSVDGAADRVVQSTAIKPFLSDKPWGSHVIPKPSNTCVMHGTLLDPLEISAPF